MWYVNVLLVGKVFVIKVNEFVNDWSCFKVILDFFWIWSIFFFNVLIFFFGMKIDVLIEFKFKFKNII